MITLILMFFSVIIASGLCSMSEAAILSLSFVRARILADEKRINSKDLLYLKEHLTLTIATIVILNNAINIVGSIFLGQKVAEMFGNQWLGVTSAALTFFIIIVSEIIPKSLGERYKVTLSLAFAKPLRALVWFFMPLLKIMMMVTGRLTKNPLLPRVTEDEIKMMLKLGRDSGTVELDEEQLCNRVFRLNDLRAVQIMKPIERIYALPADKTLGELKETIIHASFSRIAVYDENPLDIIGICQHRVLLREIAKDNYDDTVRKFMFKPIFVHQLMKADTLLEKFQQYHQHLFIVQDNTGNDVGIVTMEDVLEELFGEIYDETDIKPSPVEEEK